MIRSAGLFWSVEDVFWGRGKQRGAILGVPETNVTSEPVDFREQVGIYVLYADFDLVYVGQTGVGDRKLLHRMKDHRKDALAGRWNRFSWFGVRWVRADGKLSAVAEAAHPPLETVLNHLEAMVIDTAEPPLNSQSGRFGPRVTWYLQRRDQRLGPSQGEMIRDMWRDMGKRKAKQARG